MLEISSHVNILFVYRICCHTLIFYMNEKGENELEFIAHLRQ